MMRHSAKYAPRGNPATYPNRTENTRKWLRGLRCAQAQELGHHARGDDRGLFPRDAR